MCVLLVRLRVARVDAAFVALPFHAPILKPDFHLHPHQSDPVAVVLPVSRTT
jgi:hypothetical protein